MADVLWIDHASPDRCVSTAAETHAVVVRGRSKPFQDVGYSPSGGVLEAPVSHRIISCTIPPLR
jgi:hypothetical protein